MGEKQEGVAMKFLCITWPVEVCCHSCGTGPRKAVADWNVETNRPALVEWPAGWECNDDGTISA